MGAVKKNKNKPTIGFRFDDETHYQLKALAKSAGLSPGAYAKEATLERMMNSGDSQVFAQLEHLERRLDSMSDEMRANQDALKMMTKLLASLLAPEQDEEAIAEWTDRNFDRIRIRRAK